MEHLLDRETTSPLEGVPVIGIQAAPPSPDKPNVFHHGSFTQMALNHMYYEEFPNGFPVENIRCYKTHAEVIAALGHGAIEMAVVPVDNTYSGRVKTAITALSAARYEILQEDTIAVDQHLLHVSEQVESDIEQVMSQRPALDQAKSEIEANGWDELANEDTVMSAISVAENSGIINGKKTAAIASNLAGSANGLHVGRRLSKPGNATTFWRITADERHEIMENPNRIAFIFTVGNHPGALYDIVAPITDMGCNFTDIDCHLARAEDTAISFFAEIEVPEGRDAHETFNEIAINVFGRTRPGQYFTPMGVYRDTTDQNISDVVRFDSEHIPDAIDTNEWARPGSDHSEGSQVIYISAKNQHASLKGMLGAFKDNNVNILDLSRPTTANGNGTRGFFFVLDQETDPTTALAALEDANYNIKLYRYTEGELSLAI